VTHCYICDRIIKHKGSTDHIHRGIRFQVIMVNEHFIPRKLLGKVRRRDRCLHQVARKSATGLQHV